MENTPEQNPERVDYEVRRNAASGSFERVPVGASAAASEPGSASTKKDGNRRALWMDEDDEMPSSQVRVAGVNFAIREMKPEEISALKKHNTRDLADHLGVSLETVLDRDQFLAALRTVPDGAEKWMEFRGETYAALCREHVKGWDAPRSFNRDGVDKLYPSIKSELAQAIIQKSTLGQSNADFLETS